MNVAHPQAPAQFMRRSTAPDVPEALQASVEFPGGAASVLRTAGWKAFSAIGLPRTGDEDYSFTSVAEVRDLLSRPPEPALAFAWEGAAGWDPSAPANIPESLLAPWAEALATEPDAPAALAAAFAVHPTAVRLKAGSQPETVSTLTFAADKARADAALFLHLETGSSAKIQIRSTLAANAFLNASLIVRLGPDSELDVSADDFEGGSQTLKLRFLLEKNARLRLVSAATGGKLQRLTLQVDLLEPGASADLRGASVLAANGRCHRHVRIRHHAPDCASRQLFKAVVSDSGRSSVDGTVTVDRGAQRTDAKQLIQHLLLSGEARADSKPRLLIHADDVKCSHGSAVGKLDPEQKFYLLSRGLDAASAQRLLTQAFLAEALESPVPGQREQTLNRLLAAPGVKA